MVKLFLVCFAVCLGATSGNINFGTCSGKVSNSKELSSFSEQTITLCYMKAKSFNELKIIVGQKAILKITLKFQKITSEGITAILTISFKDNSPPKTIEGIKFTLSGGFSGVSIGNPPSGTFFNQACSDGKVLSELCSKEKPNKGSNFETMWAFPSHTCGKPEACSTSTDWVKIGE